MNSSEWMSSSDMSDYLNGILLSENALDEIEDVKILQDIFLQALTTFRFGRARKKIQKAVDIMHGARKLFDSTGGVLLVFPFERDLIIKCVGEVLKRL
jgi:hypothetical protein